MKANLFKFIFAIAIASGTVLFSNVVKADDITAGDGTTYHCPMGSAIICVSVNCTEYYKGAEAN